MKIKLYYILLIISALFIISSGISFVLELTTATGLLLVLGLIALAPAIFGPLMNVTGSVLANYWRGKPVEEDEEVKM